MSVYVQALKVENASCPAVGVYKVESVGSFAMSEGRSFGARRALPQLDIKSGYHHSPHVVILGAGASRACCPDGDLCGNVLPVMKDFVKTLGIGDMIDRNGYDPAENFESVYSAVHKSDNAALLNDLDLYIRTYFEQLQLPETPTAYDYLMLSLKPKDVIISFNWDPLLPQVFRRWRMLGAVLPELIFLHGNVDVGFDRQGKRYAFLVDQPDFEPTRLLYPVEQKNYTSDPFIAEQWKIATHFLSQAYCVTVFGYSAPVTDVEARSLLLKAWTDNPTHTLGKFEIIDIRDAVEIEESWFDFIHETHGGVLNEIQRSSLFWHPRRTCEAFAFASLQQNPWHADSFPDIKSLSELKNWIMPLISEEASGKLAGKPHH